MEPPIQPDPIPTPPIDPAKLQKAGAIGAVLITVLFTGSWVVKGVLERKAPTFFEVAFASCAACTALVDPKAVASLPLKFLERK